ncbi:MAG: 50S ribosomal protein L22 [Phycisphaerales bacterium]|jgi:large subunit ribosomal protein L22|nr:50S ribosomal protein L22 [Phycisphaerales bacterium]
MAYQATHRFARIAPRKARLVADLIRGRRIDDAITELEFSKKRAAWYFKAVLKSAIANAEEGEADLHRLVISESRVDEGPTIKRWQPKDRGRAHPINKRTSHLYISLEAR